MNRDILKELYKNLIIVDKVYFFKQIIKMIVVTIISILLIYPFAFIEHNIQLGYGIEMIIMLLIAYYIVILLLEYIGINLHFNIQSSNFYANDMLNASLIERMLQFNSEKYEDPEFNGEIYMRRQMIRSAVWKIIEPAEIIVQNILILTSSLLILMTLDNSYILIIYIVIYIVIKFKLYKKIGKVGANERRESNKRYYTVLKMLRYYIYLEYAIDVKVYNMKEILSEKINYYIGQWKEKEAYFVSIKYLKFDFSLLFVDGISNYVIYFLIFLSYYIGIITQADISVYVLASLTFFNSLSKILSVGAYSSFFSEIKKDVELEEKKVKESEKLLKDGIIIEFKNVYFKYKDASAYAIENLSFKINNKEKVAIVGRNGSGKTTVVKLMMGLYKATKGEILINEKNIDKFSEEELSKIFSSAFQNSNIYSMSIEDNMLNNHFSKKEADSTLKQVGLDDTFEEYSQYLTKMHNKAGIEYSGGQVKRFTIARVLAKKNRCHIYDEPTSSLDPINEDQLINTIIKNDDCTVVMVLHRMRICSMFNRVLVLDNGRKVAYEKFDILYKTNEYFYEMVQKQKLK